MDNRVKADLNAAVHGCRPFLCPTCGYNTNHYEDFLEHQKQHLKDLGSRVDLPRLTGPTSRVRTGKSRSHKEGVSINVFRGDETLLATVYGGSEDEARMRAEVVARALANFYQSEVSL